MNALMDPGFNAVDLIAVIAALVVIGRYALAGGR